MSFLRSIHIFHSTNVVEKKNELALRGIFLQNLLKYFEKCLVYKEGQVEATKEVHPVERNKSITNTEPTFHLFALVLLKH